MTQQAPDPVRASGVVAGADGSPGNRPALRWAADAAAAYGVPLTLVHARPDAAGSVVELSDGDDDVLGAAAGIVAATHPDLTVRELQYPESPVESLLLASRTADLVVLGSRGLGGFRGLLVGSTTMHVVPYASCPVVVVPSGRDGDGGVAADGPSTGHVVLGYDGSPAANRAAAFAFRHAEAIGAGVVVVTVERGPAGPLTEVDPVAATPGSDTASFHAPLVLVAGEHRQVPVSFRTGPGHPTEALLAEAAGAALLVVGTRGRGGFAGLVMGSVSQKLLAHAHCPVAFLHERVPAAVAAGS
jgi:nucleotide-binding universal stress UspA family protein